MGLVSILLPIFIVVTFPNTFRKMQETVWLRIFVPILIGAAGLSFVIGIFAGLSNMAKGIIRDPFALTVIGYFVIFMAAAFAAERGSKLAGYIMILLIVVPVLILTIGLLFVGYMLLMGE